MGQVDRLSVYTDVCVFLILSSSQDIFSILRSGEGSVDACCCGRYLHCITAHCQLHRLGRIGRLRFCGFGVSRFRVGRFRIGRLRLLKFCQHQVNGIGLDICTADIENHTLPRLQNHGIGHTDVFHQVIHHQGDIGISLTRSSCQYILTSFRSCKDDILALITGWNRHRIGPQNQLLQLFLFRRCDDKVNGGFRLHDGCHLGLGCIIGQIVGRQHIRALHCHLHRAGPSQGSRRSGHVLQLHTEDVNDIRLQRHSIIACHQCQNLLHGGQNLFQHQQDAVLLQILCTHIKGHSLAGCQGHDIGHRHMLGSIVHHQADVGICFIGGRVQQIVAVLRSGEGDLCTGIAGRHLDIIAAQNQLLGLFLLRQSDNEADLGLFLHRSQQPGLGIILGQIIGRGNDLAILGHSHRSFPCQGTHRGSQFS